MPWAVTMVLLIAGGLLGWWLRPPPQNIPKPSFCHKRVPGSPETTTTKERNQMLLLRTVCSTDWKGRPNHRVVRVAKTESREEIRSAMDKDVAKWMAEDIANDEWSDDIVEDANARAEELVATKTQAELQEMWQNSSRYEMRLHDADHREFVEKHDGDLCTTVYHLLSDQHE